MQHNIPVEKLRTDIGPRIDEMVQAVESCVHCGFCLPTCPTYRVLGEEMDSPRGRILLMKSSMEGDLHLEDVVPYINRCLGCLACVSSCPSGVAYNDLLIPFRTHVNKNVKIALKDKIQKEVINQTFPKPGRFHTIVNLGNISKPFQVFLPEAVRTMLSFIPEKLPPPISLPKFSSAKGSRRARVALLTGCVQQVLVPNINRATIRVLSEQGVEVVVPQVQGCCGALAMHTGQSEFAKRLALNNFEAFTCDVDAIITNAAGCGTGMKEYPLLFKGERSESKAVEFASKVMDVSEFINELGLRGNLNLTEVLEIAYHDACHLYHGQGIKDAPRQLLNKIGGLKIFEISNSELCCGSAGTYNLDQPEIADQLGSMKVRSILDTGAQAVVTGNIGCIVQIRKHLDLLGNHLPIYHLMELLDLTINGGISTSFTRQ